MAMSERWNGLGTVTLVVVASSALAMCTRAREQSVGYPECPHYYDSTLRAIPALSGPITNIPEFHDCQRFIQTDGKTYDSLYAIFAANDLKARFAALHPPRPADKRQAAGAGGGSAVAEAVAVVWSDGGTYVPLGLHPGFNCLLVYLSRDPTGKISIRAKMVPQPPGEDCATMAGDPTHWPGTDLEVWQRSGGGFRDDDYPPVARWDWDADHNWQYVGLYCPGGWCEVGPKAFHASPLRTFPVGGAHSRKEKRVYEIKGWYDEQRLAFPSTGASSSPSDVLAWATPDSDLDSRDDAAFVAPNWVPAATLEFAKSFPPFLTKFGINATGTGPFKVSLCNGSQADCNVRPLVTPSPACPSPSWWAKIEWQGAPGPVFRCVTRIPHTGFVIPGTARWRWVPKDETVWMRCAQGCCTMH
jgi:hypothetical protein